MIPIARPYIDDKEIKAVSDVLKSGTIAQGPKVNGFENQFAKFCGTNHSIAVNSGTAALHTALNSVGIVQGDEVITTPFTFIATANTILMQGAKPVFVDIAEDTFNIDVKKIEEKITKKTKAILAVDLFGHLCDYDEINEIAKDNKLIVVDDACQAVNAEYKGEKAGSFGDIAAFSFYATKNIACGEGGAITTNNKNYAEKSRLFRQHGRSNMVGYDYSNVGYNYRMTDISAAILLEQLKKIDIITKKRTENAACLSKELGKIRGLQIPIVKKGHKHVFHQYTVKIGMDFKLTRDGLIRHLSDRGIGCSVFYPKPLHLCKHIKKLGYKKGDFPTAEKLSEQVLSLPVHPHLTNKELNYIVGAFKELK